MRTTIFFFALSIIFVSCKKDALTDIETIRFGYSNFSWGPNCQRYELSPSALLTTDAECKPGDYTPISYNIPLDTERFNKAKELLNEIPEDFFNEPAFMGTACCVDCGGYYIEIVKGEQRKLATFYDINCDELSKNNKKIFKKVMELVGSIR